MVWSLSNSHPASYVSLGRYVMLEEVDVDAGGFILLWQGHHAIPMKCLQSKQWQSFALTLAHWLPMLAVTW
jgi:hypothetical protein